MKKTHDKQQNKLKNKMLYQTVMSKDDGNANKIEIRHITTCLNATIAAKLS